MRIVRKFDVDGVTVIGCGGIGSWLIPPLARFLAAEQFPGILALWDGDHYEEKNAVRQDFAARDISLNKADAMWDKLDQLDLKLRKESNSRFVVESNVALAVPENGIVLTAVDNHPCRVLIDQAARGRSNVAVISAQNGKYDGSAYVHIRAGGEDLTRPLLDAYPSLAEVKRGNRAEMGCEDLIEAGETQLLVTNNAAACCAFMAFHLLVTHGERDLRTGKPLVAVPQEIFFDIRTASMRMDTAVETKGA